MVKICGIRTPDDARAAARAGADLLGLNFHPPSPRCIDAETARRIADAVPGTALVGVFVDAPRERVVALATTVGLAMLQFHGDESPAYCTGWDRPVVKALRARPGEDLPARAATYSTDYLLLDSWLAGVPGGTGIPVDPETARGLDPSRLFVAGGLTPDTVGEVVRRLRPHGVDVASGVERAPGVKDHGKIEEFVRRAKAA